MHLCVCFSSPSSVLPPEEKSDISLGLFSPAFSSISFTSLCCSCSIAPRHFSSRIFHFVSCCHLPHPSPSHILFFFLAFRVFFPPCLRYHTQPTSKYYHFWSNFQTSSLGVLMVDDLPPHVRQTASLIIYHRLKDFFKYLASPPLCWVIAPIIYL